MRTIKSTATSNAVISRVLVGVGGLLLFGIWWISNRRESVRKVEVDGITLEEATLESPPQAQHESGTEEGRR